MATSRVRRLRALRHVAIHATPPDDADRIVARVLHEVPELARDGVTPQVLMGNVIAGDAARQIGVIVGGSARRPAHHLLVALVVTASLLLVVLACVVLALAGAFAAIGVVITVWGFSAGLLARLGGSRWGCLPRRHADLVEALLADGAVASAWVHYRAVRGIALDDETAMMSWARALKRIAAERALGSERVAELRRDCAIVSAIGDGLSRGLARETARALGEEATQWRM